MCCLDSGLTFLFKVLYDFIVAMLSIASYPRIIDLVEGRLEIEIIIKEFYSCDYNVSM